VGLGAGGDPHAYVRAAGRIPTIELEAAGGTQNRNSPLCSHGNPNRYFRSNRMNESLKVQPHHLQRSAYLYVRQSSMRQVIENVESTKRQYALRHRATALGWRDDQIIVIDNDQGESGASAAWREGFQRLVTDVGMGHAGMVMGLEVSRLARNNADWHRLLEICALADTLILDEDGSRPRAQYLAANRPAGIQDQGDHNRSEPSYSALQSRHGVVAEIEIRQDDDESDRWGQECASRKQRTGHAEQTVTDEDRHVHGKRTQNLSQSHAVDELIEGDQATLSHELLLHERDYGHASSEPDAADL
jgi:hypothetical protein